MIPFEDIKMYLPKYLTPESEQQLFQELQNFPYNRIDKIYSRRCRLKNIIYQGDGLRNLFIINLPDPTINKAPAMIISNTCDVLPENERLFDVNICYCPILNLRKYKEILLQNGENAESVEDHIKSIKHQKVTQILFLPKGSLLEEDSFVLFDRMISCSNDFLSREEISKQKLFSFSDFGLYLFVFKLSIHFTRLQEDVGRN